MISTQEILLGVGGSFVLDCEDGPITSVSSVAVYEASADDTSVAESATTGSATIDSVSTYLGAQASAESKSITVNSGTGIAADRRYQLAGADGLWELVDVTAASGTAITVRSPLVNTYATGSGSTFKACRATIAIDSTWAADQANLSDIWNPNPRYRIRWSVVVGGESRIYERYADLLRYGAHPPVTPNDVEDRFPMWLDGLPTDERATAGRQMIRRAFHALRMDLWQDGKSDVAVRNPEIVAELVIVRAQLLRMEDSIDAGAEVDPGRMESIMRRYKQRYDGMIRAPFVAVSTTAGGAAPARNNPTPLWRR